MRNKEARAKQRKPDKQKNINVHIERKQEVIEMKGL